MASMLDSILQFKLAKLLFTLVLFPTIFARVPFWMLWYTPKFTRPSSAWDRRKSVGSTVIRYVLYYTSLIKPDQTLSLKPGKEKDRFVVMRPAAEGYYKGPLADKEIRPGDVGGTWFPNPWTTADEGKGVFLFAHGGAYVVGNGRDEDSRWAGRNLSELTGCKVLSLQYRLSSNPGGCFPAALQDAVSAYKHVLGLGIPASKIILTGDSAGANLMIGLLRYVVEQGDLLPSPGAAVLWSPWVDLSNVTHETMDHNENASTDFLPANFGIWGTTTLIPKGVSSSDPYISPMNHGFATSTPIWIQTGSGEMLYKEDLKFAETMKAVAGNEVETHITPHAPHDIFLIGDQLGWAKESKDAVTAAGAWLRQHGI